MPEVAATAGNETETVAASDETPADTADAAALSILPPVGDEKTTTGRSIARDTAGQTTRVRRDTAVTDGSEESK